MSAECWECGGGFTIPMTLATAGIYAAIDTGIDVLYQVARHSGTQFRLRARAAD